MIDVDLPVTDPASFWTTSFMLGAYAATMACLYWGVREGARAAWWRGVVEIGWFSFLAIGFRVLISLTEPRALEFSEAFPDRVASVPLCIVLMAASVTYAAWKAAQLSNGPPSTQALIAGLVMFNLSLLVEPVVATGLGFWHWNVDGSELAWIAAPTLLVALANLFSGSLRETRILVVILLVIVLGFYFLPDGPSPLLRGTLTTAAVVAALIAFLRSVRTFETDHALPLPLVVPTTVALALPMLALFSEGLFVRRPSLVFVGLCVVAVGALLILSTSPSALGRVCGRLGDLDRFVRYHYFGFPALLLLLSAAAVQPDPGARLIVGLLAVGACFHVHGYVLNDVIDLDLDRTQPRRQADPLVRGAISREAGFAVAIVQLPLAALVCLHMRIGLNAALVLGLAFSLGLAYNVWGKRSPIPPLTDLVQSLGWGCLALFGALAARPEAAIRDAFGPGLPIIAHAIGFIFLVNGVHGGLRDLASDRDGGRTTTAIFFGARRDPRNPTRGSLSSPSLALFAFSVHTLMFLPSFGLLLRGAEYYVPPWHAVSWGLTTGLFAVSCYQLWHVVRPLEGVRDRWISAHAFVLVLPPLALYLPSTIPSPAIRVFVVCTLLVPLLIQADFLDLWKRRYLPASRCS